MQTLIEYKADARLVDLHKLFAYAAAENDPYEVIKRFIEHAEDQNDRKGLRALALAAGGGGRRGAPQ